jgi:hypothetical protein
MTGVISDNVRAVGYDPASMTLRVQFSNGGTYDYSNVAAELYAQMLQPHPWRRVGKQVRAHAYRKVA